MQNEAAKQCQQVRFLSRLPKEDSTRRTGWVAARKRTAEYSVAYRARLREKEANADRISATADERQQEIRDLRAKIEASERETTAMIAELADKMAAAKEGQENKIGALVDDAIPRFERLFSTPEIKQNPRLLRDNWRHPDFTWDEIRAAREAYMGRAAQAKWPTLAARWFVALSEKYDIATVRKYHNRYLSA